MSDLSEIFIKYSRIHPKYEFRDVSFKWSLRSQAFKMTIFVTKILVRTGSSWNRSTRNMILEPTELDQNLTIKANVPDLESKDSWLWERMVSWIKIYIFEMINQISNT